MGGQIILTAANVAADLHNVRRVEDFSHEIAIWSIRILKGASRYWVMAGLGLDAAL